MITNNKHIRAVDLLVCVVLLSLLLCINIAHVHAASVPNTFTAGTPAKAAEVNANFTYLSDRSWDKSGNDLFYSSVSGSIGIGTSSPYNQVTIESSLPAILLRYSGNVGNSGWRIANQQNGVHGWIDNSGLAFAEAGVANSRLFIAEGGNIGIGTASPQTLMHLYKTAGLGQTNILKVETDGSASDNLGFASLQLDGDITNLDNAYGVVEFMNKGVRKGQLLAKSKTNANSGHLLLQVADTSGNYAADYLLSIDGSNNGNVGIGTDAPTQKLYVVGNVYATGTITQGSSRELKDRIHELDRDRALNAFSQLKPVTYVYKADSAQTHIGFIAEDVPEILATNDRKGLSAMDITALLTKVVQEQQKTIDAQQKAIADLVGKISSLESKGH